MFSKCQKFSWYCIKYQSKLRLIKFQKPTDVNLQVYIFCKSFFKINYDALKPTTPQLKYIGHNILRKNIKRHFLVVNLYFLMYLMYFTLFTLHTSGIYRVCHGFGLTKQNDYFWVDFDHF
jgi:hypothetical protein